MKRQEQVLFYQFQEADKLELARKTLKHLGIESQVLPQAAWREKIGYLLGVNGFKAAAAAEEVAPVENVAEEAATEAPSEEKSAE